MERTRRPTNPGTILREMYLKPRGIKLTAFNGVIELSAKQLSLIINGHAPITPEVAVKIGRALGTSPDIWLNLQRGVDVYDAEQKLKRWKPTHNFSALPESRI